MKEFTFPSGKRCCVHSKWDRNQDRAVVYNSCTVPPAVRMFPPNKHEPGKVDPTAPTEIQIDPGGLIDWGCSNR